MNKKFSTLFLLPATWALVFGGTYQVQPLNGWATNYRAEQDSQSVSQFRFEPIVDQYSRYWVRSSASSESLVATIMPIFDHHIYFIPSWQGDIPGPTTTITFVAEYQSSVTGNGRASLLSLDRTPLITTPVPNYQVVGTVAIVITRGPADFWESPWTPMGDGTFCVATKVRGLGIQANCLDGGTAVANMRYSVVSIN